MRFLSNPWLARILLTVALVFTASCTCNDASNPAARPRAGKAKMKTKMKGKHKRKAKGKGKGKANIPKVDVALYFVDQKKLTEGAEDPWVKITRQVGAKTPAKNAVWQLFKGPTDDEMADGLQLFKSGSGGFQSFKIEGNTATLQLREGCDSAGSTITIYDHISKTLKEFPEIEHVKLLDPEGATQAPEAEGDSRPACLEP